MPKKKPKIDENDMDALEKLAHEITPERMRSLSPTMRRRWRAAKRGRPPKAPGAKSVPTMISLDPSLLKQIDARAQTAGMSRSQFLAQAARRQLRCAS